MKIEIELKGTTTAAIKIDGKEFAYQYMAKSGFWSFDDNISKQDLETTVGGLVAIKLCENMSDILQGWMPEEQNAKDCCWETWEKLTESAAEEIESSWF